MHSTTFLRPEAVARLGALVEANCTAARAFRDAANRIAEPVIAAFFRKLANTRVRFAEELLHLTGPAGAYAAAYGASDVAAPLTEVVPEPAPVLAAAEREEDLFKQRYEEALSDAVGEPVEDLLVRHYQEVRRSQREIRRLRVTSVKKTRG
jgi:uncharacterized protein (TIGR02284 family)